MRPIDADALMTEVLKGTIISDDLYGMGIMAGVDSFAKKLEAAPTLTLDDLRPKGRWLTWSEKFPKHNVEHGVSLGVFCSLCELHADNISGFCPNCGADMRGGGEDGRQIPHHAGAS